MQHLYQDVLHIIYSELSNEEIFLLKFVSKFFNESIDIRISKKQFMSVIIKTQNIEYINYWKDLVFKNIFDEFLYTYSDDIEYMLTQIDKPTTEKCSRYGNLKFLKYIHKNNHNLSEYICDEATKYNHLEILKYLHENKNNFFL